jgi:hypothetical protein
LTNAFACLYNPAMSGAEQKRIIPVFKSEFTSSERTYSFQVGLKDLDFDLNYMMIKTLGMALPFPGIGLAEEALMNRALILKTFKEIDETQHGVMIFDPRPIAYSGFMGCVRHSLAMTSLGIFEIGRYQGVSMTYMDKYWQWFIHRRLASIEKANQWMEEEDITSGQLMDQIYQSYLNQ